MVLASEYGELISSTKKSIFKNKDKDNCGPCETLPNGFHKGEEWRVVSMIDWDCVKQQQSKCIAGCNAGCAVSWILGTPGYIRCVSACMAGCEAQVFAECQKEGERCVICDDEPSIIDFI